MQAIAGLIAIVLCIAIGLAILEFVATVVLWIIGAILGIAVFCGVCYGFYWLGKNKHHVWLGVCSTLFIGILATPFGVIEYKEYRRANSVEGKAEAVTQLEYKLTSQLAIINQTLEKNRTDLQKFQTEIQSERQTHGIVSLSTANERIRYNLQLMRELDAYYVKLSEHQKATKSGMEEANFMLRRLETQKNMEKVVGAGAELAKAIDTLQTKYKPYTENLAIKSGDLKLQSTEAIWKQYVTN